MAAKTSIDAPRLNAFAIEPERLTIVTDEKHHLYDERVKLPVEENLVRNIMVHGVQVPVLVVKEGNDILVVDGRQRVRAAIEANLRLEKEGAAPVKITILPKRGHDSELFSICILANEMRQEDSPLVKARKANRLLTMNPDKRACAATFGVSLAQLERWLALLDLDPKVQKAIERGDVSATAAAELAGLSREDQVAQLDGLKENSEATGVKATAKTVKRAVKKGAGASEYEAPTKRDIRKVYDNEGLDDEDKTLLGWILGLVSADEAGVESFLLAPASLKTKAKKA